MIKQRILTVIAAAFSLLIVCGGWFLINELMDRQQTNLMNRVNSITVNETSNDDQDKEDETGRLLLSTQEITDILNVWRFDQTGYYHDPIDGQLTMEEAIKAAKSGLSYFCNEGVLPNQISENEYTQTNAFLYDIQDKKNISKVVPAAKRPSYSFWSVSLANQKVIIQLTLNAQTGQIWMANISLTSYDGINFNKVNVLDLLQKFETYLGLSDGNQLRSNEYYAAKSYSNNQIGIVAYKKIEEYSKYGTLQFSLGAAP